MGTSVVLVLPNGCSMTASLPLHQLLERQVRAGVLKYGEPAPPVGLGGEGGAERVSAPSPATESDDGPVPGLPVADAESLLPPAGNASREEWATYAVAQGLHPDEAATLKREELKARIVGVDATDDPAEG